MYTIQTLNNISAKGLEMLDKEHFRVASKVDMPDGILVRSAKMHDMELPPSLKAIARAGAGVNNIPVEKCTSRGIPVFNTPGANANSVKELVIIALLVTSRRIIHGITWVKSLAGRGVEVPALVEKDKANFVGPEIRGKKLGVIGLGAVGVLVANDAAALGMEVMGYDPYISVESAWGLSRSVKRAPDIDTLVASSDYITIHVPLTETTASLLNKQRFTKMKRGVRLLNFARAELVSTPDVLKAIEDGILRHGFPGGGAAAQRQGDRLSAPRRFYPRGRGQLRCHGGAAAQGLPRAREHQELGQFSRLRDGNERPHARLDRQPKHPEHGRSDYDPSCEPEDQHLRDAQPP